MYRLILIVVYFVLCDACVRYNFEDGYADRFTNNFGLCISYPMWTLENYKDIEKIPPHRLSEKFISPGSQLSCVTSFLFDATEAGMIEINAYMETSGTSDQLSIMANERTAGSDVGHVWLGPAVTPNFVSGWHMLQIKMTGSGNYTAYVSILFQPIQLI